MPAVVEKNFDLGEDFRRGVLSVKRELESLGAEMRDEMTDYMNAQDARATGDMIAATQFHLKALPGVLGGFRLTVGPDAKPGSTVATSREGFPYPIVMDQGARPHWAPIKPFQRWARAKFGATGKERDAIAYAAQAAIARRGFQGIEFISHTFGEFRGTILSRIEIAMKRAFDQRFQPIQGL